MGTHRRQSVGIPVAILVLGLLSVVVPGSNAFARTTPSFTGLSTTRGSNGGNANGIDSASFSTRAFLTSLRGGGTSDSSDGYDLDDIDTDTDDDDSDTEAESDPSDSSDEEDTATIDNDDDDKNNAPVQLILQTTLLRAQSPSSTSATPPPLLLDQRIEITASRTRTVASLKQSVSRQFKSRPPLSAIALRIDGELLDDGSRTLAELLADYDDGEDDDDDASNGRTMTITVDMVPPVDPKFGTEMKERLDRMTNEQVLDAYVANMAAGHQNSRELARSIDADGEIGERRSINGDDEEDEEDEEEHSLSSSTTVQMRRRALVIKEEILQSVKDSSNDETVWKERLYRTDTPESIAQRDQQRSGFGGGADWDCGEGDDIRRRNRGGATMNVKRVMQRNMNVNWPDTIRNVLLFLFFGYFGGRSTFSRSIMLLGAPACILLQARPIKLIIKQTFYAIGQPPGILLSLLPAPQQAIMSCDYGLCMRNIYGDDFVVAGDGNDNANGIEEEEHGDSCEGTSTDWVEEEDQDSADDESDEEDEYLRDVMESLDDDDDATEEAGETSTSWDSSDYDEYDTTS